MNAEHPVAILADSSVDHALLALGATSSLTQEERRSMMQALARRQNN